jgi:predicted nucleic acid-binding protein
MASKDKIFLDTDVALDHLADRQPFSEYAHRLLALSETGEITLCLSALSFSNRYYLLRKQKGHRDALSLLGKLKRLVRVSAVTDAEIQCALTSGFTDFEDAIQHFAARAEGGISAIITRNKADYAKSEIPGLGVGALEDDRGKFKMVGGRHRGFQRRACRSPAFGGDLRNVMFASLRHG